jgi:hypothetical protein
LIQLVVQVLDLLLKFVDLIPQRAQFGTHRQDQGSGLAR